MLDVESYINEDNGDSYAFSFPLRCFAFLIKRLINNIKIIKNSCFPKRLFCKIWFVEEWWFKNKYRRFHSGYIRLARSRSKQRLDEVFSRSFKRDGFKMQIDNKFKKNRALIKKNINKSDQK